MAVVAKLEMRQSQSLVMTPQLQQAIKLLQLSNLELSDFVDSEIEQNPLLERIGDEPEAVRGEAIAVDAKEPSGESPETADEWIETGAVSEDPAALLDTEYSNVDPDASVGEATYSSNEWGMASSGGGGFNGSDDYNPEGFVSETPSLRDHLMNQLPTAIDDPVQRLIAVHMIDMVDEAGYLRGDVAQLAEQFACPLPLVENVLSQLQMLDPAGVFARDLGECLALQLKEQNRYDPVIASVINNLDMLASHNLKALKRACGLEQDELAEIVLEIKALNPKPGLKFGSIDIQPVVPDVLVHANADGSWRVELNNETLPRVLVNQAYYSTVSKCAGTDADKTYLSDCLQTANWLVKSLDQRARTILKVGQEIVRQQDAFLTHGVQHLRPLNLKTVADAIKMHESTVSRVTSNKYMATPRGIFELKYFFTSAISSSTDGESHSSESVRYLIKQLIEAETPSTVLSDDKIVERLKSDGVDIARRTVAKYREAMNIPSSVQRRRAMKIAL